MSAHGRNAPSHPRAASSGVKLRSPGVTSNFASSESSGFKSERQYLVDCRFKHSRADKLKYLRPDASAFVRFAKRRRDRGMIAESVGFAGEEISAG